MSGISYARTFPCTDDVEQDMLVYSDGGTATPTALSTDVPIGVARTGAIEQPDGTYTCSVALFGVVEYVIASAPIAALADLMPAADGEVVTAAAGAGNVTFGQAVEAAAAAGDKIAVKLYGPFSVAEA